MLSSSFISFFVLSTANGQHPNHAEYSMKNRHPHIMDSILSDEEKAQKLSELLGELYAESPDASTIRFVQTIEDHFKNTVRSRSQRGVSGGTDNGERAGIKELFAGKNRKWIKIPLDDASDAMKRAIENNDVDDTHLAEDMLARFEDKEYGWGRYIGPRIDADGRTAVQFEIRYRGGKIDTQSDNPRVNFSVDHEFIFLPNTPQALGWES
jgi:hypothetical protein